MNHHKKLPLLNFFMLSALLCVLLPVSFAAANDCPSDMIAYWAFPAGSGIYEDIINGNGMTPLEDAPAQIDDGAVFKGLRFNGSSQGLSVPADSVFNWSAGESFSIEFWIRRSSVGRPTPEVIMARRDTATSLRWNAQILYSGSISFTLTSTTNESVTVTGSKNISEEVTGAPSPLRWHHVVVIRDAGSDRLKLYVDGVKEADSAAVFTSGFDSQTAPVTIARNQDNTSPQWFGGDLDEIAMYARPLTEVEIRSHYYLSKRYCSLEDKLIRIMPMGDSITYDQNALDFTPDGRPDELRTGYRQPLWIQMENSFYKSNFVGNKNAGQDAIPSFDYQNAGFPGISDSDLAEILNSGFNPHTNQDESSGPYLAAYPADVILLHIGTNDLDTLPDDVENILNEIDEQSEKTTVILAKIINVAPNGDNGTVTTFNTNIGDLALDRIGRGDKIIIVDMETGAGIDYTNDMIYAVYPTDTLHPNQNGFDKMADEWYAKLATFMPPSELPSITSTPPTTVNLGETYTYTIVAEGKPSPTYELVEPSDTSMTVNSTTGVLQWTADQAGTQTITVRAYNWAGEDRQTFDLTVLDNLAPVAVEDAYTDAVAEGGTLEVNAAEGVLKNDTDANAGDTLTAALVADAAHGVLSLNPDGSFSYAHDGSENFTDTFQYRVSDGQLSSNTVTVTFTIRPVNDPPVITGQKELFTDVNASIDISLTDLEVTDPDNQFPDDFTLTIQDGTDYSFSGHTVTPLSGFSGELAISVIVNDGDLDSEIFSLSISVGEKGTDGNGSGGGGGCFIDSVTSLPGGGWGASHRSMALAFSGIALFLFFCLPNGSEKILSRRADRSDQIEK